MYFVITNLLIVAAYYHFLLRFKIESLSEKAILIGLFWLTQIIVTELILGVCGILYLPALILLNIIVSVIIFLWPRHPPHETRLIPTLISETKKFVSFLRGILDIPNVFLVQLTFFVSGWFILAAIFLPPRGVDDLVYHLPSIYEYIEKHRIYVLPAEIRPFFAFPQNGELLFLWPTIFFHTTTPIGLVQFIVTLFGILIVYALAREMALSQRIAFFVALLFLFSPVVLAQAGSAYIDTITSVFLLLGIYLTIRYHKISSDFYLCASGIAIGLMIGIKYSMLLFALILLISILPKLFQGETTKKFFLFLMFIAVVGGFWYLRNWLVFNNPIHTIDFTTQGAGIFPATKIPIGIPFALKIFLKKLELIFLRDIGLGSLHGGYGLVFWGLALPAWGYGVVKLFQRNHPARFVHTLIWSQLAIGMGLSLLIPFDQINFTLRYTIFVIPIGLLALGKILEEFRDRLGYYKFLVVVCLASTSLAVVQLSGIDLPSYGIHNAVKDYVKKKHVSKNKYIRETFFIPSSHMRGNFSTS